MGQAASNELANHSGYGIGVFSCTEAGSFFGPAYDPPGKNLIFFVLLSFASCPLRLSS